MKRLALSTDEVPWLAPERLAAPAMPVLLMAGREMPAIHAEIFRNVCRAMPQAEIAWIEHAGHGTSRDQPEHSNRCVFDLLQRRGPDEACTAT